MADFIRELQYPTWLANVVMCSNSPRKGGEPMTGVLCKQSHVGPRDELDLARRTIRWTIQLSKFNISFERKGHIKAQALSNFITKLASIGHNSSNGREWFLSIDGVSNQRGSGTSVIIKGPNGVLIEHSPQFEFKASNNQVKYEALLVGMKLAKELEA
ncbi:hypothetical protein CR513_56145, partial [Mucuna pruriens]